MTDKIRLDKNGIYINGEYKVLLASSLFYFRIPRECWEDRMKLLKAAGYNAIDVYFPWNYHEIEPGKWNFEENRDVKEFLQLAAKNELYVIARPGPYICSEWDGGAIPVWIWEKGCKVRQDDPEFLTQIGHWYEHILPILAEYQIGRLGTIISMQIENELDFYRCISPVTYMEKLKKKAESLGIKVPMFYCCGQNDLLRGGGLTPDLYTTFNVYSDNSNRNLEERALHLYSSVQERNMPFLVTETNRQHGYLKRLLACGAKLLSPYNQTAGSTMDFYNGITNWGTEENPIALMASDYDFGSMIGSAGEVNEEFLEARLLAGLLSSFGESIAKAVPTIREVKVKIHNEESCNTIVPALRFSRGDLIEISNLGDSKAISVKIENVLLDLDMNYLETKLIPWNISITDRCVLKYSNYEIAWISTEGLQTKICLYGQGPLDCMISTERGEEHICEEMSVEKEFVCGDVVILVKSMENAAMGNIFSLPEMAERVDGQERVGNIAALTESDCVLQAVSSVDTIVAPMEKMGQYRGIGRYRLQLEKEGKYLLVKAADLVTLSNGMINRTFYANGGCIPIDCEQGEVQILTEIWGHSNFDDIRCPSLEMGSLKGIEKFVKITEEKDITEGWLFDLDEADWQRTFFFRHSPYNTIMGIDSYNRAESPLKTVYTRTIISAEGEDALFLHMEKADCMIAVYANNRYIGMVQKRNPWMDLSEFAGSGNIELTIRCLRRYYTDLVGKVTLISGRQIRNCCYEKVEPISEKEARACSLPYTMKSGENCFLQLKVKSDCKNLKLFWRGKDIKMTVYAGGHVAGRIMLQKEDMPIVAGGKYDVTHICGSWVKDEQIQIWCQATGKYPVLEDIIVKEYVSIIAE